MSLCINNKYDFENWDNELKQETLEFACIVVKSGPMKIYICLYQSLTIQTVNMDLFITEIDNLLSKVSVTLPGVNVVVGGDFNIDLLELSNASSRFLDTILSNLLYPTIYSVTRPAFGTLFENFCCIMASQLLQLCYFSRFI